MNTILEEIKENYKDIELVHLVNPHQVYFYITENVHPLWVEAGYENRLVFVFEKEPTLRLFRKWREQDTRWKNKS